jgi:1,2-dihydroxy-3-keto-5-methylthiopentene dioxygenase
MAILTLENGTIITELAEISQELAPLKIQLNHWSVGDSPKIHQLLAKASLTDPEKEEVLQLLEHYFHQLKQDADYESRDLIVLNPELPNLDILLSKFNRCHFHKDDEVRYIVDGEGVFGFVRPDGSQVELTVNPEEYINVPSGTEHWFYLTEKKRIKAVRYFTNTEGWTPEYTETKIRFQ